MEFARDWPFVTPSVRRTPAVKGLPRPRWPKALGVHTLLVAWLQPQTCPSWLSREALAALPEAVARREVRYGIGQPCFPTRQGTLVTTRLDAEVYGVADLAALYRRRWQVETSLAQLKTTMRMGVLRCQPVSGVLKALTIFALVTTWSVWPRANRPYLNTSAWNGSALWMRHDGAVRRTLGAH